MPEPEHLTALEQLLLLSTLRIGEGAYAAAIRDDVLETAGRSVSLGTIYVTLMRMEERGYAESAMGEPTPERGGKAKRLYGVTPEGQRALTRMREIQKRMWEGMPDADGAAETA